MAIPQMAIWQSVSAPVRAPAWMPPPRPALARGAMPGGGLAALSAYPTSGQVSPQQPGYQRLVGAPSAGGWMSSLAGFGREALGGLFNLFGMGVGGAAQLGAAGFGAAGQIGAGGLMGAGLVGGALVGRGAGPAPQMAYAPEAPGGWGIPGAVPGPWRVPPRQPYMPLRPSPYQQRWGGAPPSVMGYRGLAPAPPRYVPSPPPRAPATYGMARMIGAAQAGPGLYGQYGGVSPYAYGQRATVMPRGPVPITIAPTPAPAAAGGWGTFGGLRGADVTAIQQLGGEAVPVSPIGGIGGMISGIGGTLGQLPGMGFLGGLSGRVGGAVSGIESAFRGLFG